MLGLDHGEGRTLFDGQTFNELHHPMRHVGALLEAKPVHPTRRAEDHLRLLAVANGVIEARVDEVVVIGRGRLSATAQSPSSCPRAGSAPSR